MEAFALQLCLHFMVICPHTSAYLKQFNTSGHCCALPCALPYSLAGLAKMRDAQRGAAVTMPALEGCQFQVTSANKFLFLLCDIKYVLLVLSFTHASTGMWRTNFWGNYGKKEAGESVFCLSPSVFLTYSLSHHTCKWAVITLQLLTCWLSPNVSLCLFLHDSSHLTLFYVLYFLFQVHWKIWSVLYLYKTVSKFYSYLMQHKYSHLWLYINAICILVATQYAVRTFYIWLNLRNSKHHNIRC